MKDILKLSSAHAIGKPPATLVVADQTWLSEVPDDDWAVMPSVNTLPLEPDEQLTRDQLTGVELLVLEVNAEEVATLRRLEAVKRLFPKLPIIAALQHADITVMRTLLRHDVSDVVSLPFDIGGLTAEIYNIGAKLGEAREIQLAPSLTFVGARGGAGVTSILLHLAHEIVEQSDNPIRCCLIDLDIQSGQIATQSGIENSRSILSLLEAGDRLDQDMLRNVATKSGPGVYVISAPSDILPIEQVDTDLVLKIVALARAEFDFVLVDLPPAWSNWSLSVAADSDQIIVVSQQSLSHLRQARKCIDLFREVGIGGDKVKVVVNRATKGRFQNISVQDVADTLRQPVIATVREDKGELSQALDEGHLVWSTSRKNVFARDIEALAEAVLQNLPDLRV